MSHYPLTVLGFALPALAQLALFLHWLHRRMRDDEIARAFVRDMAVNHLPHIYSALRQIAERQGIVLSEPPLVHFLEVDSRSSPL